MFIILADKEPAYLVNLQRSLIGQLPDFHLITCENEAAVRQSLEQKTGADWLCLYNSADFQDLPDHFTNHANGIIEFWPIQPGLPPVGWHSGSTEANREKQVLYRHEPVSLVAGRLLVWQKTKLRNKSINKLASQSMEKPLGDGQIKEFPKSQIVTDCDREISIGQEQSGLHFLFSMGASGYSPDISWRRIKWLIRDGRRIIYLPLMPSYLMSCLSMPGRGPSLSDLLLQILGKNIRPAQLGVYLQPNPAGFLQFRPPDRSDDLVLCNPDILRQLIVLLHDYLRAGTEMSAALIDCAGIPLASVAMVAVLCDSCEILLPDHDCFATEAARREASQLLARLPCSCQIINNQQTMSESAHPHLIGGLPNDSGTRNQTETDQSHYESNQ